jgi:hypothetical protein
MKLGHIVGCAFAVAAWALFPGCAKENDGPPLGQLGESCQQRADCAGNLQCLNGACTMPSAPDLDAGADASMTVVVRSQLGESCTARIDCVLGLECVNNVCSMSDDAGSQTGAGKRGESCRSRGDCIAGLSCVSGVCQKADFGIQPTTSQCVQIDCMVPKDCCPKITDTNCPFYQSECEGGINIYCTDYNQLCKCNEDQWACTTDNKCKSKTACTDAAFSCPTGYFCNGGTECVRCLKDDDCGTDQMCTALHTCQAKCTKDGDCPYLQSCSNGECVDTGCTIDRECIANTGNPLSVCASKKCKTPCQTDAECNLNGYRFSACVAGFCQDIGCQTDEECRNRLRIPVGSNSRAVCQKMQ